MSNTRSYDRVLVGVDAGTTVTKAVAFSPDGVPLARAAQPSALLELGDGRYEQDTDQVVASVERVLAELSGAVRAPIEAVGVTAQGDGLWLVDGQGRPTRNAISWMDARAAGIVQRWQRDGLLEKAFRRTGGMMFPGASGPLLAWMQEHEPSILDASATAAYCKDVVLQRLTGVRATDPSDASMPFGDPLGPGYDETLLDACGLAGRRELLAPVSPAPAGALTGQASRQCGLVSGTPIIAAPYDLPACAWGADLESPGDGVLIVGTTLACQVLTDRPGGDGEPTGFTLRTWRSGRWLRALPAMVGTAALDWVLRLVGADHARLGELLETGRSTGLAMLPYLSEAGERAPFVAPEARGRIYGLSLGTRPADLVRTVCEAVAYSARHCLEAAGLSGQLTACGGGLATPQWAQIFADVLDRPVRVLAAQEIGARGAALAAASVAAPQTCFPSAPGEIYQPRAQSARRYADGYGRYLELVAQARAEF